MSFLLWGLSHPFPKYRDAIFNASDIPLCWKKQTKKPNPVAMEEQKKVCCGMFFYRQFESYLMAVISPSAGKFYIRQASHGLFFSLLMVVNSVEQMCLNMFGGD